MPEVNFAITDKLDNIAGLSPTILSELLDGSFLGYKVKKLSDIKKSDLHKLPKEAYLTIEYTRGSPYKRSEVKYVAKEIMKKYHFDGKITGSYRRKKSKLNDIDILTTSSPFNVYDDKDTIVIRQGDVRIKILFKPKNYKEYFPIDILFTTKDRYPFALMHFTGSKEFNIHMSKHAIAMGMKLSVNGLYKNGVLVKDIKSEKDIFTHLKLKYIPPEKRNN